MRYTDVSVPCPVCGAAVWFEVGEDLTVEYWESGPQDDCNWTVDQMLALQDMAAILLLTSAAQYALSPE